MKKEWGAVLLINQCRNGGRAVPLTPLFFAKILHLKGSKTRRTSEAHEEREGHHARNAEQITD